MLLMAITGLGASCTNEDLGGETTTGSGRSEIQLVFSGANGESQEYTKAIASETENEIKDLKVYLFASDAADGTYYYLETWTEGTAYNPEAPSTDFKKQASGTSWVASIYPNELKGLPYLKLMCVANNTSGSTTDGNFYDKDNTKILDALVKVTVDGDGKVTNAAAATTEVNFRTAYTKFMKNEDAGVKDIIHTPLLMTGAGQTKISGSVSKVKIDMKRVVARFDIDNTSTKSQLTINTITLAQARKSGSLWNTTLDVYDDATKRGNGLMTYADITYTDFVGANQGTTESALYAYPGLDTDESYLIIIGTYKSPIPGAGNQIPVTYHVPIQKTVNDATSYIAIEANNRYKLRITDVTQSNIYASFEVVDWTSGGGIHIKPDNDAPKFDKTTGFETVSGNIPAAIGDSDTDFKVENGSSFNLTVAATGKVYAETAPFTKADATTTADWLTVGTPAYEEIDGIWYSKFKLEVNGDANKQPVSVKFINDAASYDPDLWTTLTFYGPSEAPLPEDGGTHSLGNTVTDATASMYNVVGSYISVKTWCVEGTTLDLGSFTDKLEVIGSPVKEGFYTTFRIKIKEKLTDPTATITFKNSGDNAKETTFTITSVDASASAELGDDANTYATLADTKPTYAITTDVDALGDNTYTLKINAPQGVTVDLPNGKWLKVVKAGEMVDGISSYTVKLNKAATTFDDFDIKFVNKLDASDVLTVTMKKKVNP